MLFRLICMLPFIAVVWINPVYGQTLDNYSPKDIARDESTLRKVQVGTDGKELLEYLRERTFPDYNPKETAKLISSLGSPLFQIREKSFSKILMLGSNAVYSLREARNAENVEVRERVQTLLQVLEDRGNSNVQSAVVRLIAARQPKGAAGVLLKYLPFAADDYVVEEINRALALLTVGKAKVDPEILAGLEDKSPTIRQGAGQALVAAEVKKYYPRVRKLLQDPDWKVRVKVAMAFLSSKQKDASDVLPVLIKALEHLDPEDLWEAEAALVQLAGKDTPQVSLGTTPATKKVCREAWEKWYQGNKGQIDLAKLDSTSTLGLISIVHQTPNQIVNNRLVRRREIIVLDSRKKVRFKFNIDNNYPTDARILSPTRILVAEYRGRCVTERDNKGNIVWRKNLNSYPISVQRLANGNTFVALRNQLLELDRQGNEVYNNRRNSYDIYRAAKLRNGTIAFIDNRGRMSFINPKNNQTIKSFNVGHVGTYYGGIDVLPNGNLLVPIYSANRVVEYNQSGKEVWRGNASRPTSAVRLPNGNTLIGSIYSRQVVELNRQGNQVWSQTYPGQIYQVRFR